LAYEARTLANSSKLKVNAQSARRPLKIGRDPPAVRCVQLAEPGGDDTSRIHDVRIPGGGCRRYPGVQSRAVVQHLSPFQAAGARLDRLLASAAIACVCSRRKPPQNGRRARYVVMVGNHFGVKE
jgi:hypothetical protein